MNRRIDEVFGMLKLLQDESERQAAASAAATGDRGLFVIGPGAEPPSWPTC
jgi:hypothetical protein